MAAGSGVVNDIIGGVGAAGEAGTNRFPRGKTHLLHLAHHQHAAGVVVVELEIIVIGIGKSSSLVEMPKEEPLRMTHSRLKPRPRSAGQRKNARLLVLM